MGLFASPLTPFSSYCISFSVILNLCNYYKIYVMKIFSLVSNYFNLDKDFFLLFFLMHDDRWKDFLSHVAFALQRNVRRSWMAYVMLFIFIPNIFFSSRLDWG